MVNNIRIIVGLGKTGLSCANYFTRQHIPFSVMDTRIDPPGLVEFQKKFPQVIFHNNGLDEKVLLQANEIILSPGISLEEPAIAKAIQQGIKVVGDIELFAQQAKAPIVAITGTNAKGTVTTLVGDMARAAGLKVCVGGNIGIPALDLLSEATPDLYVLEVSSFQLETTYSLRAAAATILNITPDHLDRHKTIAAYAEAKQRIYQRCKAAVYNREDPQTIPFNSQAIPVQFNFGLDEPAEGQFGLRKRDGKICLAFGTDCLLSVDELLVKGQHNWANALAALALGTAIQLPLNAMLRALRSFKGLEHRCEWVTEYHGVTWYNDSKGTNVGATLAALNGLGKAISGKLVLIAGGLGKGADFSSLAEPVKQFVRSVVLIGKDADLLADIFEPVVMVKRADSMEQAVNLAAELAVSGDAVLLSPACASFDMFRDFEDRGVVFKNNVRRLCAKVT